MDRETGKFRKRNRIWAFILSFSILAVSLAGCGNAAGSGRDKEQNASLDGRREEGEDGMQPSDVTAMGRYVEQIIDLSGRVSYGNSIYRLEDGKLVITDYQNDFLVSSDNGETWEADESTGSRKTALTEMGSVESLAVGKDNTVAVIYDAGSENPSEEENPFDINNKLMLIKPDGTQTPVEVSLTEDEENLRMAWISDQGRIFVSTYGSNLYEIKEDGSSEVFLTLESEPMLITFQNNLLIADGWDYETLLIYDMEKKEYIEDEVLKDFLQENYKDRTNNGGSFYDLFFSWARKIFCTLRESMGCIVM